MPKEMHELPKAIQSLWDEGSKVCNQAARSMEAMHEALECVAALDMPNNDGVKVLEAAGWSYSDRFHQSATEFVSAKVKKTLEDLNRG